MKNKIIVRYVDGAIMKGTTEDFSPGKLFLHISNRENGAYQKVYFKDLKAVFFVKDFEGNADHQESEGVERAGFGKKMRVRFKDGETIVGYTQGFSPEREGFILFHSDPANNNEKVFVITAATDRVDFVT